MTTDSLDFHYDESESVAQMQNRLADCVESISLGFDDYDTEQIRGPGLYLTVVANHSVAAFAEPMGTNTWPTDTCDNVHEDSDDLCAAATAVARSRDGGVCIGVDGTIMEQMVRFKNVTDDELPEDVSAADLDYADWMGARHMSAYETSLRPTVVTTITLSEESGRITTFQNGGYSTVPREDIGEPWRGEDSS